MRRLLAALLLLFPALLRAHELGAVQADIRFARDGGFRIEVQVDPEHLPLALNPYVGMPPVASESEIRARQQAFETDFLKQLRLDFDGQPATWTREDFTPPPSSDPAALWRFGFRLRGQVPAGAASFTWFHPFRMGQYLLRLSREGDAEPSAQWVQGGQASQPFALAEAHAALSRGAKIGLYLKLGYTHILPEGIDHILFVLGLFFLTLKWKPMLAQVTTFTVAHSLTLGLSILGLVSLSPRIVEPLIAVSIVYVAVENLFTDKFHPWRLGVIFGFGLLHGLGFAGALKEIRIPKQDFLTALVSFNCGVELGQLTVILLAFLLLGLAFGRKPWWRARIAIPASLLIGATGLFWTVQRVFF